MSTITINKRGYSTNSAKTIEIIEGNIDLILYNDRGTSFFFFRFSPEDVIGTRLGRETNLVWREQVEPFLARFGKEYDGFINELYRIAIERDMGERYEM